MATYTQPPLSPDEVQQLRVVVKIMPGMKAMQWYLRKYGTLTLPQAYVMLENGNVCCGCSACVNSGVRAQYDNPSCSSLLGILLGYFPPWTLK